MIPSTTKNIFISFLFMLLALLFLLFVGFYHQKNIAKNGEYHTSLYVINSGGVSKLRIVAHIERDRFLTTTYLSSPALRGVAKFISKGKFIKSDEIGSYVYHYKLTQVGNTEVIDPNNAEVYLNMIGRAGLPKEEKIMMLYNSNEFNIFDMMRYGNVLMYAKK
jgi:hypothetical protein